MMKNIEGWIYVVSDMNRSQVKVGSTSEKENLKARYSTCYANPCIVTFKVINRNKAEKLAHSLLSCCRIVKDGTAGSEIYDCSVPEATIVCEYVASLFRLGKKCHISLDTLVQVLNLLECDSEFRGMKTFMPSKKLFNSSCSTMERVTREIESCVREEKDDPMHDECSLECIEVLQSKESIVDKFFSERILLTESTEHRISRVLLTKEFFKWCRTEFPTRYTIHYASDEQRTISADEFWELVEHSRNDHGPLYRISYIRKDGSEEYLINHKIL